MKEKSFNHHNGTFDRRQEQLSHNSIEYLEEDVQKESNSGSEEAKNYLCYDASKLEPGFYIITKRANQIVRYLKIYLQLKEGYPNYVIKAYNQETTTLPDCDFDIMAFSFGDLEDSEKDFYRAFTNFFYNLNGRKMNSVDETQGKSYISVNKNSYVTTLYVAKDIKMSSPETKVIEINLGDADTCTNFYEIVALYNELSSLNFNTISKEELVQVAEIERKDNYGDGQCELVNKFESTNQAILLEKRFGLKPD